MDITLSTRVEGAHTVVTVAGEVDTYTAPKLREELAVLVQAGRYHLVVDLEQVEYLDSTGLGILIGVLHRIHPHQGSLRLVCTQDRIIKIFRITGLSEIFPFHDTVLAALAAQGPVHGQAVSVA